MAASAQQLTERPACSLPILTSGEVARLSPFLPKRTLRFLRMFVETVEDEVVGPMLRQPTFVEAVEVMERNLPVIFAVRRPALSLLFADARRNPTLMENLRASGDLVREELREARPDIFAGDVGAALEEALLTVQRTNDALLRFLERVGAPTLADLQNLAELERVTTQVDILLMTTLAAVQRRAALGWFAELVAGVRAEIQAHARLGNLLLFQFGHVWQHTASPEVPLLPDEREAAVEALVGAFEVRDVGAVRAFLLERAEVFELLQATLPKIDAHFGNARRTLTFVPAEHWNDRHLAVRIVVPEEAELAAKRDAFEDSWWTENAHRAFGGLVIAVRPS